MDLRTTQNLPVTLCSATRQQWGFTLIELLVTIAIAAILLGVTLPSLASYFASVRLAAASTEYFSALLVARTEAIKRNGRVTLCKSADGATCSISGDWTQGWIVFSDTNEDSHRTANEQLILRRDALEGRVRVTGNLNVARYVSFTSAGNTQLIGGAFQAGTLTFCPESESATRARQIVLSAGGRPRLHTVSVLGC